VTRTTKHRALRIPVIGRLAPPFGSDFVGVEATGAIAIGIAVVLALLLSNSPWAHEYARWTQHEVTLGTGALAVTHSASAWVNEGLMTLFFFVVGLELKREVVAGELRNRRAAALPVIAALGGILLPAAIFVALNAGGPGLRAWAVPTTTDTAFAVGFLALLGSRVAPNAKVLLLSIAIVDDLCAILVIAFAYSNGIEAAWIAAACLVVAGIVGLRRAGVASPLAYVPMAIALWITVSEAGFHATVAGVVLGFLTPLHDAAGAPVLARLEHRLHPWSTLLVVPVFALVNAGMALDAGSLRGAVGALGLGIAVGLVIGKLIGVLAFATIALRAGWASLPAGVDRHTLLGVAATTGVGFSVSLFIAELALTGAALGHAKIGILVGSLTSAAIGTVLLTRAARRPEVRSVLGARG
jgi:NhaA family Na+:H+ antiporter